MCHCESLINLFVKSIDLLLTSYKQFSILPELYPICNQLYQLVKQQSIKLAEMVNAIPDKHKELREELQAIMKKYKYETAPESMASLEDLGTAVLTVNPEQCIIQQRQVPRPEFAFENGQCFSLDADQHCILTDYDMFEYQLEEVTQ